MTDTTAKINAKGLDSTGVTEDLARKMRDNLGGYYLAIVELKVNAVHEDAEGNHKVDLVLSQVEPSTTPDLDNHLRELTRTLHYNRKLHSPDDQLQIETLDDVEPKVEDVIAAGQQHIAQTDDELPDPDADPDQDPDEDDDLTAAADDNVHDISNPFATTH